MLSLSRMRDRKQTFLPQVKEKSCTEAVLVGVSLTLCLLILLGTWVIPALAAYYYATQQKN